MFIKGALLQGSCVCVCVCVWRSALLNSCCISVFWKEMLSWINKQAHTTAINNYWAAPLLSRLLRHWRLSAFSILCIYVSYCFDLCDLGSPLSEADFSSFIYLFSLLPTAAVRDRGWLFTWTCCSVIYGPQSISLYHRAMWKLRIKWDACESAAAAFVERKGVGGKMECVFSWSEGRDAGAHSARTTRLQNCTWRSWFFRQASIVRGWWGWLQ